MYLRYRAEVDGLRAVAVGAVVLYHAGMPGVAGGYAGVDVFFVISGYLITALLLTELAEERFSLRNFYERRARRLLPALAVVIVATAAVGVLLLNPTEYIDLAQSLVATGLFAANVYFWQTTDYFGPLAEERPLLHMWSLAVEEQFYIAFPLFLLALWRWRRDLLLPAFLVCSVISLGLAEFSWRWKPVANFYLPTGRAWELLAGAMAAWHLSRCERRPDDMLAAAGLVLIIGSVMWLGGATPYPSLWTAVPVVGTVLVILFADPTRGVGRFLSLGPIVGLGLISYSVYLWHQPLFAFVRVSRLEAPSPVEMGLLVGATLLLGWVTWRWVEQPFRRPGRLARGQMLPGAGAFLVLIVAFGTSVSRAPQMVESVYLSLMSDAAHERYRLLAEAVTAKAAVPTSECALAAELITDAFARDFARCAEQHGQAIVVLGGSHAADMFGAISSASAAPFVVGLSRDLCRPHQRFFAPPPHECPYEGFRRFAAEHAEQIAIVLYTQAPHTVFETGRNMSGPEGFHPELLQEVTDYLADLATDVPVLVLGPKDMLNVDISKLDPRHDLVAQLQRVYDPGVAESVRLMAVTFERMAETANLPFVSIIDVVDAPLPEAAFVDGLPTYHDWDHWSAHGERVFGPRVVQALAELGYESILPPQRATSDYVTLDLREMR